MKNKRIKLEVFVTQNCESTHRALSVAEVAVKAVEGVEMKIRYFNTDGKRARQLGIFMVPAFVIDNEIFSVGEPKKEDLIKRLQEELIKKGKG